MRRLTRALARLRTRRSELTGRLDALDRDRRRQNQALVADFADQAQQRENDEVLDRLDETTRAELNQVQHAIEHIERGLFGFCERCGEPIESARLQAVPQATSCARCAAATDTAGRHAVA